MAIILASGLGTTDKDETGVRRSVPISKLNNYRANLVKFIPEYKRVVYVANNPTEHAVNDERGGMAFTALEFTGLKFAEKIILDGRNTDRARAILTRADLVFLAGGEIECQKKFFDEIKLKSILLEHGGLTVGGSAGAMNLCETVFNFPETPAEALKRNKKNIFTTGLGFFDGIIVPHFNAETMSYALEAEIDVMKDYIIPKSFGREFLLMPENSYILLNNGKIEYFGDFYKITDGVIRKI